jgi:outer membrane lipoprotein-sorting protein
MRRATLWLFSLVIVCPCGHAAETGREILRRALDLNAGVQDYTAEVVVVMDLPNLQVPRRTAKVYFKRPNKVGIKSRGIVMIPKRALMPGNLGTEITQDTRVDIIGRTTAGGHPLVCLRLTDPKPGPEAETLLVWVRTDRYTVERMEIYARGRKNLGVAWTHQLIGGRYWMPRHIAARIYNWRSGDDKQSEGTVTVDFSNMQVNTGLSDKLFEELK